MINQIIGLSILAFAGWLIYKLSIEPRDYGRPRKPVDRTQINNKPYQLRFGYGTKYCERNKHDKQR